MNNLNNIKITPPYELGYHSYLPASQSALIHVASVASGQHPAKIIEELVDLVCSLPTNPDSPSALVRLLGGATEVQLEKDDQSEKNLIKLEQYFQTKLGGSGD